MSVQDRKFDIGTLTAFAFAAIVLAQGEAAFSQQQNPPIESSFPPGRFQYKPGTKQRFVNPYNVEVEIETIANTCPVLQDVVDDLGNDAVVIVRKERREEVKDTILAKLRAAEIPTIEAFFRCFSKKIEYDTVSSSSQKEGFHRVLMVRFPVLMTRGPPSADAKSWTEVTLSVEFGLKLKKDGTREFWSRYIADVP